MRGEEGAGGELADALLVDARDVLAAGDAQEHTEGHGVAHGAVGLERGTHEGGVVAVEGGAHVEGDAPAVVVHQQPQGLGEGLAVEGEVADGVSVGVEALHAGGLALEAIERLGEHRGEVRVGLAAVRVGGALLEDDLDGALGARGVVERVDERDRRDAADDGAAHAVAVAADVLQRRPAAVGAAGDVDALIAQGGPEIVEIVHRRRGPVPAQVGPLGEGVAAGDEGRGVRKDLVEVALEIVRRARGVAVETVGSARAALAEQDDVAVGAHPPAGEAAPGGRGGDAGAALEDEDRVGLRCLGESSDHHDVEVERATVSAGPVLEDGEGAPLDDARDAGSVEALEAQAGGGGDGGLDLGRREPRGGGREDRQPDGGAEHLHGWWYRRGRRRCRRRAISSRCRAGGQGSSIPSRRGGSPSGPPRRGSAR